MKLSSVVGDTSHFDQVDEEGSLADGFVATYGERGRLVAVTMVGPDAEREAVQRALVAHGAPANALRRASKAALAG